MEQIIKYVKPELLVLAVVLYFLGDIMKKSQGIKDKYIPAALGACGVALCCLWVLGTSAITNGQEIAMAAFTAIVQGILVAGLSTYVNQIIKQAAKE